MSGLDEDGGIGERGFIDFERDFGADGGVADCLGVAGCSFGTGEAEGEARAGDCGVIFSDAKAHGEVVIGANGVGIFPVELELFDGGEGFTFCAVENGL